MPTLREVRLSQFLTQQKLAERAGVSKTTIVSIELGSAPPRISTSLKLAEALGVEPGAIDWPLNEGKAAAPARARGRSPEAGASD